MGLGKTIGGAIGGIAGSAVAPGPGTAAGGAIGAKGGTIAEEKAEDILGGSPPFDDVVDFVKENSCGKEPWRIDRLVETYQKPHVRGKTFEELYSSRMVSGADKCNIKEILKSSKQFFYETSRLKDQVIAVSDTCDWDDETYDRALTMVREKENDIIDKVSETWEEVC